jgi:hypothetical protein
VKPFTPRVRSNIDNELVDKSIDFMRRHAAGKPLYLHDDIEGTAAAAA